MQSHRHSSARHHQQGFTLVEIGVVLVIIGLLLGAVLKGQAMLASARVTNLIQNMNSYRAAINGFQDRYRIVPGDSGSAATKVGNGAINCTRGCDDGLITMWTNTSLVNNHLSAAGLYSGPAARAESGGSPEPTEHVTNPGGAPIFAATAEGFLTYASTTGEQTNSTATGVWTG